VHGGTFYSSLKKMQGRSVKDIIPALDPGSA
jgi:hypothetical protein